MTNRSWRYHCSATTTERDSCACAWPFVGGTLPCGFLSEELQEVLSF